SAAQNKPNEGKTQLYNIVLESGKSVKNAHYQWLTTNLSKCIDADKSTRSFSDKNCVKDFSAKSGELNGYTALLTQDFVDELKNRGDVKVVEKEGFMTIQHVIPRAVQNKPPKDLDRIDQANLPLDGKFIYPDSAGQGVNIFIVDTGVRITHQEFEGRAKFGGAFCDGCNNQDENGHGTNVASIAAGKTFGVAKNASIIAVRVLDAKGSGTNSEVINGLAFVLDQHNKGTNKNSVVNLSLGGPFSEAVNLAVESLTKAGVHVAVAAGNDGDDACKSSPSSEPTAITVGATEDNDALAGFSNIGKCVDIYAPGVNILGAGNKNDNDTLLASGTSQATPHVAGTLALIIAKSGNQSPADMAIALSTLSTKNVIKGSNVTINDFLRVPAP
ncbi:1079_t:CDS:2, partial [Dentiscutata erythropus]